MPCLGNRTPRPKRPFPLGSLQPVDGARADGELGVGAHSDYGNKRYSRRMRWGGLMVRDRAGRWLEAPVVPCAYLCNTGDCRMRWSNDTYVWTPEVVSPRDRDRYSAAFFLDPNPDAEIACLPTCAGPGHGV